MSETPRGWKLLKLRDVATLKTGPFGSALHKADYTIGGIPLINPTHIREGKLFPASEVSVSSETAQRLTEYRLNEGDIVMGRRGEMGRCAVVPKYAQNWLCGTGSVVVKSKSVAHPQYLQRLLTAPATVAALIGDSVGSTMINLNQGVLLGLDIPLPPLPEQKRIADKLDSVLARVDACRDRLDRLPALLKRFRQSILAAATSGRLTEDWREQSSLIWNPRQTVIGKIGEVVTGSTPSKKVAEHFGGIIPFFKPSELNAGFNTSEAKEYLSDSGANEARLLPPRTVMVTCIGATIGKTGLSRCAGATNQQINSVICDEAIATPEWLYFWCESPAGQMAIIDNSSATTLPILNKSRFMALDIEVPPLPEQTEIVRRVEILFAFADRLEARLATARRQVGQLTPALLAKAFRGELVAQDPADEPATELLKRLAAQRENAPKAKRDRKITNP